MPNTLERIYIGQPGTTNTDLGSPVAVGSSVTIKQILFCNTTANEAKVTIHLVPSGASPVVANRIVASAAIPGNSTETLDMTQVLRPGDKLSGIQITSGAITLCISGVVKT